MCTTTIPTATGDTVAALIDRVARRFGQVVAATIVAGIAWGDIRWADLLVQATVAALGTLLIDLTSTLPEVPNDVPAPLERAHHVTVRLTSQGGTISYTEQRDDGWHCGVQLDGSDLVTMYRTNDLT
ncbi:hypothetical protein ACWFNS_09005 [Oerskovia enterophila]